MKLYDLGGALRCGPALMLLQYAHEVNAKLVWDWANLAMLAVPLQSAVALYGLARIATAVPSLFSALGTEHQRLQQAMRSSGEALSAEDCA